MNPVMGELRQINYSTYPYNKMSLRLGNFIKDTSSYCIFTGEIDCYSACFSSGSPSVIVEFYDATMQVASFGSLTDASVVAEPFVGFDLVNLSEGSTPNFYLDIYTSNYNDTSGDMELYERVENDRIDSSVAFALFSLRTVYVPGSIFNYYSDFKITYSAI